MTSNFILRTSQAMFLFVIKRCLYLVFHRLKMQIAWGAFLVKKNLDLLMLISTDLSSYSAVQQSCTPTSACSFIFSATVSHIHFSMIVPFKTPIARKGEAFRLWDFDRWSANDWKEQNNFIDLYIIKTAWYQLPTDKPVSSLNILERYPCMDSAENSEQIMNILTKYIM